MSNRKKASSTLTKPNYVNAPLQVYEARLQGSYEIGCDLGVHKYKDDYMLYFNNGLVTAPRKAQDMWFLAQYMRFGLISTAPNYKEIADNLILDELYEEVAKSMGIAVPDDGMKPFKTNLEPTIFDPSNPAKYLSAAKK